MTHYRQDDRRLTCLVCGQEDFEWHEGLKETRGSEVMGWSWLKQGVDKLTCTHCGFTMSFARNQGPGRPTRESGRPKGTWGDM